MKPQPDASLADVATNMRTDLQRVQWTRRVLRGGLELLLERKEGKRYRLACAREVVPPSEIELKVLAAAFGLPNTTEWQRHETKRKKGANGQVQIQLNPLHVAECIIEECIIEEEAPVCQSLLF